MRYDIIVVGGGYAGMAAALQLVRARRSVLVIDAGLRRNRFASHSYGFLGQDGVDPAELAQAARCQLEVYPTLTWVEGTAEAASGEKEQFAVTSGNGERYSGRRLLFATGVSDTLPTIEGLPERWGKSVFHCPYCHGYELNRGRIGVIATGPMSLHQAQLIPEWGEVTFFTNNAMTLDDATRADLAARGVTIEQTPISQLHGHADVILSDARRRSFAGLFTASRNAPSTPIAETLGREGHTKARSVSAQGGTPSNLSPRLRPRHFCESHPWPPFATSMANRHCRARSYRGLRRIAASCFWPGMSALRTPKTRAPVRMARLAISSTTP